MSAGKGIHLSSRSARKWHFIWSRNNLQLLARWVFTYALWPRGHTQPYTHTQTHTYRQRRRRSGKCKQDTKAQAMTMTGTTMRLCCNCITSDCLGLQRCLACLAWLTDFDRSSNRTINKIRPCVATMCVYLC